MTVLLLATLAGSSCLPLPPAAERIVAADLAGGWPALAAAAPDAPVGLAPAPGVQRTFTGAELQRIGARLHIDGPPPVAICVERPNSPLDPARLLDAMRRALPEARIELIEHSRAAAPPGDMVFPLALLQPTGLWRGYIEYAPSRRYSIWARVKVRTSVVRVVAVEALPAGRPIAAAQVKIETIEAAPGGAMAAQSPDEVVGLVPHRSIAPGKPVLRAQLAEPPDVVRGQSVQVEVRQGAALLQMQVLAEADGRRGERVVVKNPSSGRRFLARVAGKGLVVVGGTGKEP